ncbi:MAG: O-antigen ligase family protein, partial [Gemmatimonadales bacterium]
ALPRAARIAVPPARVSTPLPPGGARVRPVVNRVTRAAFYLFVFSIPFELADYLDLPLEVPTVTGALFLLASALHPSAAYRRIPAAVVWFGVYLWFFGLSTLVNQIGYPILALELALLLLEMVLILWVGGNLLRDPFVMRGVLLTLALACGLRAALQVAGLGATTHAEWGGGVRVTFLSQNPNLSAIILSAGLITALDLRPRLLFWLLAGIMGVAIIQTGSRGGLLCTAVGMLVLLWQGRTALARLRSVLFGFLVLALLAFGAWRSDLMRERFLRAATEHALAGREHIYPATLQMVLERPIVGWGPIENQAEIAQRIGDWRQDRRDAHNIVLELLSATGILGAVPFLIGLWLCIRNAWRARRGSLHMLPFALLATVLTGSVSGTWIASKVLWLTLAIGLTAGAVTESRRCAV